MRVTLLAFVALLASSLQPVLAADDGANPTQLAQRLERELSQSLVRAQSGMEAVDTGTLDRIDREIRQGTAQWAGRQDAVRTDTGKLEQLRGLLQNARIYNDSLGRAENTSLPYSTLTSGQRVMAKSVGSLGSSCELAWPAELGKPLSTDLAPASMRGDQFWLRIKASEQFTAVSTLGSNGDVDLTVYAKCGDDQPVLVNDDYYGLQALAQLPTVEKGEQFVRVRNLDAQTPIQARIEAILAGGISGTISIAQAGAASPEGLIVSYFSTQSSSYLGITSALSDGSYSLTTLNAGSYYLRTANYSSQSSVLHQAFDKAPCGSGDYYYLYDCDSALLTAIVVSEGQTTANIDFNLELARSLQIIARDAVNGQPVAAVATLYRNGNSVASAYADATGRVRFSSLHPDIDYRLVISADGFQSEIYDNIPCIGYCDPASGTPIIFPQSGTLFRELTVDLTPARRLLVHVPILAQTSSSVEARLLYPSSQIAASGYSYYQGTFPGYRTILIADPPIGTFYLQAGYGAASFWRIYPNIDCLDDCASVLTQGQTISTSATPGTQEIYVDVRPFPTVLGTVTDAASGEPIAGAPASTISLGSGYGGSTSTDASGDYRLSYVRPGTYLVVAGSPNHVDVAYPDAPCSVVNYTIVCPTATPVTVGAAQSSYRFDFALTPSGRVSGNLAIEGSPPPYYYYPQLNLRRTDGTMANGFLERVGASYSVNDVDPGTYRASMPWQVANYGQIYPGIDCAATACESTSVGQALVVDSTPLTGINFDLRLRRGAKGRVVDASTGLPVSGVILDVWLDGSSFSNTATISGLDGKFVLAVNDSYVDSYKIATSTGNGYMNEIYRNVQCPLGPAIYNLCDINLGEAIDANHAIDSQGITISLMPESVGPLFDDSFDD